MPPAKPRGKPAKFGLRYTRHVGEDLRTLAALDPTLVDAALAAVDDLIGGHQRGKLLGQRHVAGDLAGLARLRFDPPGTRPHRFRIAYRLTDHDTTMEVIGMGERADHAIYRDTRTRRQDTSDDTSQQRK